MKKKIVKADRIMSAYVKSFLGFGKEFKELLERMMEWKENGMKEEEYFICTPFELHVVPDAESPSLFVSVRDGERRLMTVAEVFHDGYSWDFWCDHKHPELKWRLGNLAWLWNRIDVEGLL